MTETPVADEGTAPAEVERQRIMVEARNMARAAHEMGLPEHVERHWHAVAGWLRAGCPHEPDLRGDA